ncbi:hypothetical protein T484DRAFT_1957655, partial [Baffinella frigidus]
MYGGGSMVGMHAGAAVPMGGMHPGMVMVPGGGMVPGGMQQQQHQPIMNQQGIKAPPSGGMVLPGGIVLPPGMVLAPGPGGMLMMVPQPGMGMGPVMVPHGMAPPIPGGGRGVTLSPASASKAGMSLLSMVTPQAAAASGGGGGGGRQGSGGEGRGRGGGGKGTEKFATDTQISNVGYKERTLEAFDASEMVETDASGENEHFAPQQRALNKEGVVVPLDGLESSTGGGWDQFKANEEGFGAATTYTDEFYTTQLDKTKISADQRQKAERLAAEIMNSGGGNSDLLRDLDDGTQ